MRMGLGQDSRGRQQRAAREMIEGAGMVLQRRMQVGLRRVAGVAGFGEQRQVGQTELFDQSTVGFKFLLVGYGWPKKQAKNQQARGGQRRQQTECDRRWPHQSSFLTAATTLSVGAPSSRTLASLPSGPMM